MIIKSKSKIFRYLLITFILGVAGFSFWQRDNYIPSSGKISFYNGQNFEFSAVVVKPPDKRLNHTKLTLAVEKPVSGKVLLNVSLYPEYQYGDQLLVNCKLKSPEPFEGFAYDRYLAKSDIYSQCSFAKIKLLSQGNGDWLVTKIFKFKNKLQQIINSNLPEPQASLFSAVSLGARRGVPKALVEKFNLTGTTHLMAISGLHITIFSALLAKIFLSLYFSRQKSFWVITLVLILYIIMIGFPASAVRAGIMGWLVMLAMYLGRLNQSTNAILLAASLMLAFNPKLLLDDIGFQLSFAAVLGIVNFSSYIENWLKNLPNFLGLRDVLVMTFAAQLSTAPLIIFYFERFSLISPVVNLLVVPILPYLMIVGLGALLFSLILPWFSLYLFFPVYFLLTYIIKIIELFSLVPYAVLNFN